MMLRQIPSKYALAIPRDSAAATPGDDLSAIPGTNSLAIPANAANGDLETSDAINSAPMIL